jgi:hypothetical protein
VGECLYPGFRKPSEASTLVPREVSSREIPYRLADYGCLFRGYKRPIVTISAKFKDGIAMQWNSSPRRSVRSETAAIDVEQLAVWWPLFSAVRDVSKRGYDLLRDHRKLKWVLTILVTCVSFQSYFMRQLLAALFFFTIFYIALATLAVLYILIVEALDCGTAWVASLGRSFVSLAQHYFASPARVPSVPKRRALDGGQKLGHT